MNKTKIEYLDFTWNPGVGCSGTGCAVREKCWAMRSAKRQKCPLCKAFVPHFHPERLNQPIKRILGATIGCCFSGEFFELEPEARAKILNVIHSAYWHEFLILTKQPHKIPHEDYPDNLWIGVTINKVEDLWRLGLLKNRPGVKHRFISFEPLYEDLKLANLEDIEWIIIGAQTRPLKLPARTWVTNLMDSAEHRKIPVFMKNNLYNEDHAIFLQEFPSDLM